MKKKQPSETGEQTLSIELYGHTICIVSNCEQTIVDITTLYDHFITEAPRDAFDDVISVIKNQSFTICYNGDLIHSDPSPADSLLFLEWFINSLFLKSLNHFFQIHAGVVSHNDQGILMPAINEVGKSTFTFYLVQKGFHYYSDEIGFIDIKTKRVFPFPKSIALVKDTYHKVLKPFDGNQFKTISHSEKVLYQPHVRKKDLVKGAPLQYIFFLKRERVLSNPLTECSKGNGLIELIKNSFNPLAYGEESFNHLVELLAATKIFFLDVSKLEQAYHSVCEVMRPCK